LRQAGRRTVDPGPAAIDEQRAAADIAGGVATPILLPVMQNFGVNPVHFGMIMLLNLGIGLCHPPVGSILFVGCAVGKVTIEQVMRKIWPFGVLMLVTYLPAISLWLPQHVLR
jgi:TRAP-type C4-dicarboxylate transport system permease large subunit